MYTVFKILAHDDRQLLLIQDKGSDSFQICVYDEHSGSTLMRLTQPTVDEFERAIQILKKGS
jgi:hypothetical protein